MNKFLTFAPWVGLLIFAGLWYYETNKIPKINPPGKVIDVNVPIEKRYTDSAGNEHVVVQDGKNVITKAELKNPERPRNIIDSAAANLKIAASEIQRVTRINTMIKDSLLKATRTVDLLTKRLAYVYKDPFVDLRFTPPTDSTGEGTFDFAYNADLNIVQYQKRKWFLGKKNNYLDISSNDKRTTIRGVKQLTVQVEDPTFGLRLQGSANYSPESNNLGVGPAIRLDLGRFSIQGNYLYYPSLQPGNKWRPGIIGNYDIIRF